MLTFSREARARNAVLNALPKNAVGVEVGVWKGDFSEMLLRTTAPKRLHLVDPWIASAEGDRIDAAWYGAGRVSQQDMDAIHAQVSRRFAGPIKTGQVTIHRKTSAEALDAMGSESVDYVYIDGDHSYEAVAADLEGAYRIVKLGGAICCDDYLLGQWWQDGVVRAVHEFLSAKPVVIGSKANSQIVMRKRA